MKKISLYFGDVFWCTAPYAPLQVFHELSKKYDVLPIFAKNDIRLHKKWNGTEKFYFDVKHFRDIPYVEAEKLASSPYGDVPDLASCYKKHGSDILLMSCQMQFKPHFSNRNIALTNEGVKIALWDVGGSDALYVPSSNVGWSGFFSKGKRFKDCMMDSSEIGLNYIDMNESGDKIVVSGTPDFDEIIADHDLEVRTPILDRPSFCEKYSLDPGRPIIAYIPANPRPDGSYTYPSGITARQALADINNTLLRLQSERGYQVCFKTHPGDYIDWEDSKLYAGLHPRARFGGYKGPRYIHHPYDKFTTISAEDGFNLYRNCEFGVTNYSHAGYELFLCKKPVISYRMNETDEWKFVGGLCEMTYTDVKDGEEMHDVILKSKFSPTRNNHVIGQYFENVNTTAASQISNTIGRFIDG